MSFEKMSCGRCGCEQATLEGEEFEPIGVVAVAVHDTLAFKGIVPDCFRRIRIRCVECGTKTELYIPTVPIVATGLRGEKGHWNLSRKLKEKG